MAKKMNLLLTALLAVVCLTALLCAALLPTATPAQAADDYIYEKQSGVGIKDNVNSQILLVASASNGKTYAINATGNFAVGLTEVTVVDNKITTTVSDSMLWTVGQNGNYYTYRNVSYNNYLSASGPSMSGNYTATDCSYYSGNDLNSTSNDKYIYLNGTSLSSTTNYNYAITWSAYKKALALENPTQITFDKGSSEASGTMANTMVEKDSEYTLPSCSFTRSKYLFNGWSVNGEIKQVGDKITVSEATTITATWAENYWTITLQMEGQEDHILTVQKGDSQSLSTNENWWAGSTPEGKLFLGWQLNGETVASYYKPTEDVTLVAVFADAVNISFDWDGGNAPSSTYYFKSSTVAANSEYTLKLYVTDYYLPSKNGYVFCGWKNSVTNEVYAKDLTGSTSTDPKVTVTADTTFIAQWKFDGFTITFMVGDEIYATKTYAKVTEQYSNYSYYYAANGVEEPTAPEGQVFSGWTTTSNYNSNNKYSVYNASSYSSSYLTLPRESSYGGITNYDVVLTANFAIAAVFKFQNEDGTVYKTETKTLDSSKTSVDVFLSSSYAGTIPSGYGLLNWTDEEDNVYTSGQRVYIYSTDTVFEKTLTVHYGKIVTISFDFNGGSANSSNPNYFPESKTYEYAAGSVQKITASYNPEKTNYILTGWKCGDLVVKSGVDFTVADEDMCFVAQWKYDGITLTFNDGTNSNNIELASGTTSYTIAVDDPEAPSGQKFLGWQIAGDDSGTLYSKTGANKTITIDGDEMTLNAVYRDLKTYNVILHYGETSKTVQYVEGTKNILFNVDTLTSNEIGVIDSDHIFMGWYKDAAFTTQMSGSFLVADDSFENLHLYAKIDAYYHVYFDYGFKANASDETNIIVDRRAAESSQGVVALNKESGSDYYAKDKYELLGWATEIDGAVVYAADGRTNVTSACTLYAVWDYNYYVVTIKLFGSDEAVGTVEVAKNRSGNTLVKINELKDSNDMLVINWTQVNVEGKDAIWAIINDDGSRDTAVNEQITLTSDITLQVRFSDHLYTITINWVGGKLAEIKQAYNTDVTAPETDKAGYTFVAFYLNDEQGGEYTFDKMPSQDIVVWAKYEILDSTLKFDTGVNGSEIADVVQKTGTQVDKPADPTREGYLFVKWQIEGSDVVWLVKEGTGATTNPEYYINMPGGTTTMVAKWELTAEGLAAIKAAKLAELDAYVTEKDVDLPESYSNAINNATTEAGVNEAYEAAIAKVDELKAEKDAAEAAAAQALADAKTAAKAEIAAKAEEEGVSAPSTEAIDAATSIEAVNTAKAAALAAIAQAKADKEAAEAAAAESKAKVDAAKAKVAALSGKNGAELYEAIKAVDAALAALSADEKAQVNLAAYNQAKSDYSSFVAGVQADLAVAEKTGASIAAISLAGSVAALAALAYVLKRRMF